MSKYVVQRKNVCAGQLLKTIPVSYSTLNRFEQGQTKVSVSGGIICRGMLFEVNEDGLAHDLIYTTPVAYPIAGIEPKTDIDKAFHIENYVELEELLKYLGYAVDLTQRDLNQIYRKFIIHEKWLEQHLELFGWKKLSIGYGTGGVQTLPMSLYYNLSSISCYENGKPSPEEPQYSLIKKRK